MQFLPPFNTFMDMDTDMDGGNMAQTACELLAENISHRHAHIVMFMILRFAVRCSARLHYTTRFMSPYLTSP